MHFAGFCVRTSGLSTESTVTTILIVYADISMLQIITFNRILKNCISVLLLKVILYVV